MMSMLCAAKFCAPAISGGSCYRNMEFATFATTSTLCAIPKLDPDIEEIAKKIQVSNEKKMVQIRNIPVINNTQRVETNITEEIISEDWTSIQGQFGWEEISNVLIPYLTRSDQKYACLRIVESKIFLKYRQLFGEELWNCFRLQKVAVTKAEAALLNEINVRHSDGSFGSVQFTTNEVLITLNDVRELHDFMEFSFFKLVEKNSTEHKRCGYIRIAGQNCVPYVWCGQIQYVPLFYFEGECRYLEERAVELRGWDLAYIKLLCKMQGIRKALFDNDSIRVVEMDLVKKFFPPDTQFSWMWLTPSNVESLMHKSVFRLVPVEANKLNNQERTAKKRIVEHQVSGTAKKMMQMKTLPKVPEVPYSIKAVPACPAPQQQNVCPNAYVMPSVPSSAQRNNLVYVNRPTYPVTTVAPTAYKQSPSLRNVSPPNTTRSRVFQIQDFLCNSAPSSTSPYFLVKNQLETNLYGINMEPYVMTVILIPLEELATTFFRTSVVAVINAVNVMRLDIFLPNKLQIRLLERCSKYPTAGLVKYKDFTDNIPQLRYILTSSAKI